MRATPAAIPIAPLQLPTKSLTLAGKRLGSAPKLRTKKAVNTASDSLLGTGSAVGPLHELVLRVDWSRFNPVSVWNAFQKNRLRTPSQTRGSSGTPLARTTNSSPAPRSLPATPPWPQPPLEPPRRPARSGHPPPRADEEPEGAGAGNAGSSIG